MTQTPYQFPITQLPYQFQYNTGDGIVTFMVTRSEEPGRENAYHIMIEENESIAEFYGIARSINTERSLAISRAITDLPIWLHSGNVLKLLMREIDNVMH
jgi:hypothetical protein